MRVAVFPQHGGKMQPRVEVLTVVVQAYAPLKLTLLGTFCQPFESRPRIRQNTTHQFVRLRHHGRQLLSHRGCRKTSHGRDHPYEGETGEKAPQRCACEKKSGCSGYSSHSGQFSKSCAPMGIEQVGASVDDLGRWRIGRRGSCQKSRQGP